MAARQLGMKPHLVLRWPGEIVSDEVGLGMRWWEGHDVRVMYCDVRVM